MKTFLSTIRPAALLLGVFTVLLGIIYPLFIAGVGDLFFPASANGSLIEKNGKVIGSVHIAQNFTKPEYFHPRPSAAGYDGANSKGSNLGPTSLKLDIAIKERLLQFRTENNLPPDIKVPGDAVTSSGSGLDPHISPENAYLQASRVAKARNLTGIEIEELIKKHTEPKTLIFFGAPRVNVLKLNLALDRL